MEREEVIFFLENEAFRIMFLFVPVSSESQNLT